MPKDMVNRKDGSASSINWICPTFKCMQRQTRKDLNPLTKANQQLLNFRRVPNPHRWTGICACFLLAFANFTLQNLKAGHHVNGKRQEHSEASAAPRHGRGPGVTSIGARGIRGKGGGGHRRVWCTCAADASSQGDPILARRASAQPAPHTNRFLSLLHD
ncbi:unnamed protein product, partial [Iphiclides podalirius]